MRSRKKVLQPIAISGVPVERFSLRVQNGVEIYEHESAYTDKIPKPTGTPFEYGDHRGRGPRLIVAENSGAESPILAKTRAEITGLISMLRQIEAV